MFSLSVFLSLLAASLAAEVCYPPCGCFNDDPPWNGRDLPTSWQQLQLHYNLYTRGNWNNPRRIEVDSTSLPPEFSGSRDTKFMIHGWLEGDLEPFIELKDTFLDYQDVNVVIVEWDSTNIWYPQNAMDTRLIGACSAQLVQRMVQGGSTIGRMQCLGLSLGGQACGFMGKASRDQFLQQLMPRVTGLDPAGPEFDYNDPRTHIARGDASFVDIIHTNADFLGMGDDVADVDFFPNGGGPQPPCEDGLGDICDHTVARDYYRHSIEFRSQCQFNANACSSIEDANAGRCNTCSGSSCSRMGHFADTMPGRGGMYLRTVRDSPFCEN